MGLRRKIGKTTIDKNEFSGDLTKDSFVPDQFHAVPTAMPTTLPSMGKSGGLALRNGDRMISTLINHGDDLFITLISSRYYILRAQNFTSPPLPILSNPSLFNWYYCIKMCSGYHVLTCSSDGNFYDDCKYYLIKNHDKKMIAI